LIEFGQCAGFVHTDFALRFRIGDLLLEPFDKTWES
jgi:hypothetical protein